MGIAADQERVRLQQEAERALELDRLRHQREEQVRSTGLGSSGVGLPVVESAP